jgi:hypothetical protein
MGISAKPLAQHGDRFLIQRTQNILSNFRIQQELFYFLSVVA